MPHNGGPRFGYVKNDDVGRDDDPSLVYTVDLRTGPWLRQCYEQYVAGKTITKLVFELNENGIVTTSGGRFTFRTLQKVLDSGFGAGLIIDRRGVDPNTDNPNLVEYYQGAHEAVIDEQTWEAYVRRRATKVPPRAAATATKLSGRLYCVSCRRRMRIYWSSKSRHKSRHRGFECGRDKHSNQTSILCPAPVSIRQTVVEAGVYNWLREKERGLGEFERALERQRRREQAHADADAIDVEIARLARRRQRLLDVFLVDDDETEGDASGPDSNDLKAEYLAKRAEFDAEIEALTAKADELRAEDVGPLIPSQDIFMNLLTMYDRADVGMMSEALGAVVQRIYVHREDTDRTDLLDRLEVIAAWEEDPYAMLPA